MSLLTAEKKNLFIHAVTFMHYLFSSLLGTSLTSSTLKCRLQWWKFLHFLLQQSSNESSLIQTNRITLSRCKSIKLRYSTINPSFEYFHWNISTNLPNYSLHRSFKSFKSWKLFTTWILYLNLVNLTYLAQPLLAARWKRWQHNA